MRKLFVILTFLFSVLSVSARKAIFYFDKAYLYQYNLRLEKGDYVAKGEFVVIFDTNARRIEIKYQMPDRLPYTASMRYRDVSFSKSSSENQDIYYIDDYCFTCNGYDKRKKYYWIDFVNDNLIPNGDFMRSFTTYFGLDGNDEPYCCLYFEKPYKVESK